jgi:hypothetical protein
VKRNKSKRISGRVMKIRILMNEKVNYMPQIYAFQTGCSNEEKEFEKKI